MMGISSWSRGAVLRYQEQLDVYDISKLYHATPGPLNSSIYSGLLHTFWCHSITLIYPALNITSKHWDSSVCLMRMRYAIWVACLQQAVALINHHHHTVEVVAVRFCKKFRLISSIFVPLSGEEVTVFLFFSFSEDNNNFFLRSEKSLWCS